MSATIKNSEKKKILAPELRFKEFDDEWVKTKLGEVGKIRMCKRIFSYETTESGDVPFYKIGTFGKEADAYITNELYLNFKNRFSFPKVGDILMSASGTLGRTVVYDGSPAYFQDSNIVWIDNEEELITNSFLYYIYQLVRYDSEGGTIQRLYNSIISKAKFCKPSLPEQQKIASFLSAVDEKIQQLTRKKELLEQYKKGVMQQLFSGKLRFKPDSAKATSGNNENGKAFPKWEEKLYGDVYSFYSTNSFSRDNLNYESGFVKNIHYGDIHTKFTTLFDVTREIVPFINDDIDISKIKEDNYCKEGDLVIADASEDYADIGKSIELVKLNNEKIVAGLHTFLARPNKIKMHKGFSGHLVKASYVRKQIMTIAQGTKVLSLSTGRLGEVKLKIPCIEEQKKIANYLSNLDNKIESVNKQITQTQTFKKGLLQQMFV